eukprot:jgi/Mesen1/5839/ME000297S05023
MAALYLGPPVSSGALGDLAAPRDVTAGDGEEEAQGGEEPASVQFDLELPRRTLQVQFTCNKCEARTTRLLNPHAFARGTVYVQCGNCQVFHQLVDNLGLVTEYDFRVEEEELKPGGGGGGGGGAKGGDDDAPAKAQAGAENM